MQDEVLKPMGIGRMIDLSIQLYRKHFVKLTLIMLICYGPFYLVQGMVQDTSSTRQLLDIKGILDGTVERAGPAFSVDNPVYILLLILTGIMVALLTPVVIASIVLLVRLVLRGEEVPSAFRLLGMGFKRFWALLGSSIVYGLIIAGMSAVLAVVIVFLSTFSLGGILLTGGSIASGVITGIFVFLLILGMLFGIWYFTIRFMYYLPVVAFQEASVGVGISWSLTRKSFWRIIGLFVVMTLLVYVFSIVVGLLLAFIPMNKVVLVLLQAVASLVVAPAAILAYGVSYFDLKARDGMGLEEMIQRIVMDPAMPQPQPEQTV
ncbi:hypothetical protein [Paenibacillus koleovorans]|uniref:hypothetical protein n=1 Tax=Paenibacillus koleovorans TaxID=121608 RepID=UPI000FDAC9EB|nr:hypothetical protein [Paenibacillus koleovorans]